MIISKINLKTKEKTLIILKIKCKKNVKKKSGLF